MSNSLRPRGLQHARLPCPSPSLRAFSNSCPLSQWCHPTISSSVIPFSSCPHSFPASGSFPTSQLFTLVVEVLELQFQHQSFQRILSWFPLWLLVWSSCSPRDPRESFPAPQFKSMNSSVLSFLNCPTHICMWLLERPLLWLYGLLSAKWCLCF